MFTTASPPINNPPVFSRLTPSNGSTNISISLSSISLTIRDPEGKSFNYTIQTHPNIGSTSVKGAFNGTQQCSISGLTYSTTYRWYVNATDGITWTNHKYVFTTKESRYDVNNNNVVNFQDAGLVWIHRTTQALYDELYDVNQDGKVNYQDVGITWTYKD
jgi:archaellin